MKFKYLLLFTFLFSFIYPKSAHAQNIDIDLGVPDGSPLFVLENMLPGDNAERPITVKNTTNFPTSVDVSCKETDEIKQFSEIIEITIKRESTDIYGGTLGTKTIKDFCDLQNFNLGNISGNQEIEYTFLIYFPTNAGNEFQLARFVFDLLFKTKSGESLVINEVYYNIKENHGYDCLGDRNIEISGNGAGSQNYIDIRFWSSCVVVQNNSSTINTTIQQTSTTGNSNSSTTGNATSNISVVNIGGINISYGACGVKSKHNDEWIEIYNPTQKRISLKGWKIVDNSGKEITIRSNTRLDPGNFALISRSSQTWRYWDVPRNTQKIYVGDEFGDGLDNSGDHLFLINPQGIEVDATAWGTDTSIWNPSVPVVAKGSSQERKSVGFDTNLVSDWVERNPPTPGS